MTETTTTIKKTNFIKELDGSLLYYPIDNSSDLQQKLEPNIYILSSKQIGFTNIPLFIPNQEQDKLVNFASGQVNETIKLVDNFLSEKTINTYKDLKIMHKIDIMLHSPPGTGKTCTATLIMRNLVSKYNALAINCTGTNLNFIKDVLKMLRRIQDSPIILFVDEIDNSFDVEEHKWLTFLDGSDSLNNIIILGCTNNIDEIPDRIKNRKSRIKHLIEIKSFPIEVYKEFINDKLPNLNIEELSEFAFKSEEKALTLDQLKHAIIDHVLEEISIDEAITNSLAGI